MPRNSEGVFYYTPNTEAIKDDIARSAHYNQRFEDVALDLNQVNPVATGGTGASTPAQARINLGITDPVTPPPGGGGTPVAGGDAATLQGYPASAFVQRVEIFGVNTVGTSAFLSCTLSSGLGSIRSANTLRPAGLTSGGTLALGPTGVVSGSWRSLGNCPPGGAGLFIKISA